MRAARFAFLVAALAAIAAAPMFATPTNAKTFQIDPAAKPARMLSEYNLFGDASRQTPSPGLIPYDLNTPLFSDYAAKHRFVGLPEGASAAYQEEGAFEFPVGTVLVKSFGFLHDLRNPALGERIIETRLLIHTASGWVGLPYLWNDDMSDARLAVAGATVDVAWTHLDGKERRIKYIVPNMNQCKQCHEIAGKMQPIGPKARHLNKDYAYTTGPENQLVHWSRMGCLTGAPGDPARAPRIPNAEDAASGTVAERARAWLDINCAHCHNPEGPAYTSGLDLSWPQTDPARYGVMKPPVAAGRAAEGRLFGIVPGKPDESILMHRIESVDPGVMMPPLPRRVVHDEGAALIRAWIAGLK